MRVASCVSAARAAAWRFAARVPAARDCADAPPARFLARSPPDGAQLVGDEARLLLYALYQQARAAMRFSARRVRRLLFASGPYPDATPALRVYPH